MWLVHDRMIPEHQEKWEHEDSAHCRCAELNNAYILSIRSKRKYYTVDDINRLPLPRFYVKEVPND